MNLSLAAQALGGQIAGPRNILCPGPGHSIGDRSLSVTFDPASPDGFLVHSFAGDDWRVCKDHVRTALSWNECSPGQKPPASRSHLVKRPNEKAVLRQRFAIRLWYEARPIVGTLAERYLRGRGLSAGDEASAGLSLRFHARCPFTLDDGAKINLPSLIGLMRDPITDDIKGITRIALDPENASKANMHGLSVGKRMLGPAGVVKLSPPEEVTGGLFIAEGIETALACMTTGFRPIWACLGTSGILNLPPIRAIDCLTIFADNDENGAGQRAALQCAKAWQSEGKEIRLMVPPSGDFADHWGVVS